MAAFVGLLLMKILQCSGEWPCAPCVRANASPHGHSPVYMWMLCLPFSMKGVDIYDFGIHTLKSLFSVELTEADFPCSQHKYDAILSESDYIISGDVELRFESYVTWDIDTLALDFATWVSQDSTVPATTSRAGIMSSLRFERLIVSAAAPDLGKDLRLIVEISTFFHCNGAQASYAGYSAMDLWSIRALAGSNLLRSLETALSNTKLAKASDRELKALFLILFGAVIAVGYTTSINQVISVSNPWTESRAENRY